MNCPTSFHNKHLELAIVLQLPTNEGGDIESGGREYLATTDSSPMELG